MKRDKIIYWIFTGLLSAWMLLQGFMFVFNSSEIETLFESLGFPSSMIIPLGIAKILAVVAILLKKSTLLKQLAYLGLLIDFVVAIISHLMAGDGQWPGATIATVILVVSYLYDRKVINGSEISTT